MNGISYYLAFLYVISDQLKIRPVKILFSNLLYTFYILKEQENLEQQFFLCLKLQTQGFLRQKWEMEIAAPSKKEGMWKCSSEMHPGSSLPCASLYRSSSSFLYNPTQTFRVCATTSNSSCTADTNLSHICQWSNLCFCIQSKMMPLPVPGFISASREEKRAAVLFQRHRRAHSVKCILTSGRINCILSADID